MVLRSWVARTAVVALIAASSRLDAQETPETETTQGVPTGLSAIPPSTPPQPKPSPIAAWVKGEGFRIQSADGNWKLRVGLQLAFDYEPRWADSIGWNWSNFLLPYVRPRINGTLLRPWIEYWCSLEFRQFPPFLLDCMFDIRPWKFFGIRAGQYWTPLSRHEYLGPQELVFPDWAPTADYFWTGRDRGVQLFGETEYIDWYASFTAGTTLTQVTPIPGNFQLQGRVSINPLGAVGPTEIPWIATDKPVPFRFSFTLQGSWGRVNPNGIGFNPSDFLQLTQQGERNYGTGAADLLVQWQRLGVFGEFYGRRVDPRDVPTPAFTQWGAWAQVHYTFWKRALDGALRFDWIRPSSSLANDDFYSGEAMVAWYIYSTTLALRVRYGFAHQADPGAAPAADPMLLNTVGLPTSPGWLHLLTLQLQLAI
jgi:hypothetical protein